MGRGLLTLAIMFIVIHVGFSVLGWSTPNLEDDAIHSAETACSALTLKGETFWATVTRDFQVSTGLIPQLVDEVTVTLSQEQRQGILDASDDVGNATSCTIEFMLTYIPCVQDIYIAHDAFKRSRDTSGRLRASMGPTDFDTYARAYTLKATRVRKPIEVLFHNLGLLKLRILTLRKLLLIIITSEVEEQQVARKLTNVLDKVSYVVDRCFYYVGRIDFEVTEGLVTITAGIGIHIAAHSSPRQQEEQQSNPHSALQQIAVLESIKVSTEKILASWVENRERRDEFLFDGNRDQMVLNLMMPLKEGVSRGDEDEE